MSFNKSLSLFAPYFGIIAAILALASWLATNQFGARANAARDALRDARAVFDNASQFRRLYALVNEETQDLDHVYTVVRHLAGKASTRTGSRTSTNEERRYDELKRLEYARHGDRFAHDEWERAKQLVEIARELTMSSDLTTRAEAIRGTLEAMVLSRETARREIGSSIRAAGDPYSLDDAQWTALEAQMEHYRRTVEIDLIPAANDASSKVASLETEIISLQMQEADRRGNLSRKVQRFGLILYVLSALLAVYGKWLEVTYPKPAATPVSTPAGTT